jgi:hypothetical protein
LFPTMGTEGSPLITGSNKSLVPVGVTSKNIDTIATFPEESRA